MMKNRRWIQVIVMGAILLVGGYTIGTTLWGTDTPVKPGYKAPDFSLVGIDGQQYKLSDFKGKAVVLNFWGTFCPPCVEEMPALQRQHEQWKSSNVVILGINLNESLVTVKGFIRQHQITFPILLDNDQVRKTFKVTAYPTTFYIDSEGTIKDVFVGGMKESDILIRISNLIE
ncbi:MAG: redoxin domain-containing protein [Paenibacillaceae bacterium]